MVHRIVALYRATEVHQLRSWESDVQAGCDRPAATSAVRGRFNSTGACEVRTARRLGYDFKVRPGRVKRRWSGRTRRQRVADRCLAWIAWTAQL